MYDSATRERAVALYRSGMTFSQTSRATGISRHAIRQWTRRISPSPRMTAECRLRQGVPWAPYVYLLGLYLGDGCISVGRRDVYALRIACGDAWPGLIDECERAIRAVMPHNRVKSADIVHIFTDTLDAVGVEWKARVRSSGAIDVSIARRASVELMDRHVGPKH